MWRWQCTATSCVLYKVRSLVPDQFYTDKLLLSTQLCPRYWSYWCVSSLSFLNSVSSLLKLPACGPRYRCYRRVCSHCWRFLSLSSLLMLPACVLRYWCYRRVCFLYWCYRRVCSSYWCYRRVSPSYWCYQPVPSLLMLPACVSSSLMLPVFASSLLMLPACVLVTDVAECYWCFPSRRNSAPAPGLASRAGALGPVAAPIPYTSHHHHQDERYAHRESYAHTCRGSCTLTHSNIDPHLFAATHHHLQLHHSTSPLTIQVTVNIIETNTHRENKSSSERNSCSLDNANTSKTLQDKKMLLYFQRNPTEGQNSEQMSWSKIK